MKLWIPIVLKRNVEILVFVFVGHNYKQMPKLAFLSGTRRKNSRHWNVVGTCMWKPAVSLGYKMRTERTRKLQIASTW
jgi:hypothetical protein